MTTFPKLLAGERIDTLGIRDWGIIQRKDEFRFSLDAVLLAQFATIRKNTSAVDLGTGTGAVALFLLFRGASAVSGLELNSRMASMAARTAEMNGLSDRMGIVCGDVREVQAHYPAGRFDLVTANPPYRLPATGRISPAAGIAMARHETAGGLKDFIRAAAFLLRNLGRLAMIHLPERLTDLCVEMRNAGLEPKRLRLVHPFPDRPPRMVLIEAIKGSRPGMKVLPPLNVYRVPGEYQPEILSYYR